MTAEEIELVGDEGLVGGAVVDVEVVDAGVGAQLPHGSAPRGGDRGARPSDAVGLADANEPGTVEAGGVAGGPVGAPEQPA